MVSAKTRHEGKVKDLFWMVYGPFLRNPAIPPNPVSFLFVCKGNLCRSPFAEKLSVEMARKYGLNGLSFRSAGLQVNISMPSPKTAVEAAKDFDIDLSQHRSKPITRELVRKADVVVCMEASQFWSTRKLYPEHSSKIILFPIINSEVNAPDKPYLKYNISDPYGKDYASYLGCYGRLKILIKVMLDMVRK